MALSSSMYSRLSSFFLAFFITLPQFQFWRLSLWMTQQSLNKLESFNFNPPICLETHHFSIGASQRIDLILLVNSHERVLVNRLQAKRKEDVSKQQNSVKCKIQSIFHRTQRSDRKECERNFSFTTSSHDGLINMMSLVCLSTLSSLPQEPWLLVDNRDYGSHS